MSDLERPVDGPAPDVTTTPELDDDLSPSVRRLVRHYDLDITGIHGTGPSGRIRVGDVMPLLGGRENVSLRGEQDEDEIERRRPEAARKPFEAAAAGAAPAATLGTVVFECDLSRVLAQQKRAAEQGTPIAVESYIAQACARALAAVPEINADRPRIDIAITIDAEPAPRRALLRGAASLGLDDIEHALAAPDAADGTPTFSIRHYGASGGLLALPLEPADATRGILGVGKLRKRVVVKTVNGEDAPRVAAMCYMALSFDRQSVAERSAHAFLRTLVGTLEG